jgi:hypothetical protein
MQRCGQIAVVCAAAVGLAGAAWMTAGSPAAATAKQTARTVTDAEGLALLTTDTERLAVLWTSGDPEVAHRVALMYTHNAKKQDWFDEVRLIIWGPSQRLLVADKDVKAYIRRMQDDGVIVQACIVCANSYGIADDLRSLDIEVKAMGVPLTEHLKDDWKILTF